MTGNDTTSGLHLLLLVGTVTAVVVLAAATATGGAADAGAASNHDGTYSLVQGDACTTITSVGNGLQTVEAFYGYRSPETEPSGYTYSSHGTTRLQEPNTSVLFLYEGRDGLGLVIVHGAYDDDSAGGMVTMEFSGLPADGEWVVEDDSYSEEIDGGSNDIFVHEETASRMAWVYRQNRTDGAAFRIDAGTGFEIRIVPRFNNVVDFAEDENDVESHITDWQVVSSTPGGYTRTSLDMETPITIRSSPCARYVVTDLAAADEPVAGQPTELRAEVLNDGVQADTFEVTFVVDGDIVDRREVTLEPNEGTTVTTTTTFDEPGTYSLTVADTTANLTVVDQPTGPAGWAFGDGIDVDRDKAAGAGIAGAAVLAVGVVVVRRLL